MLKWLGNYRMKAHRMCFRDAKNFVVGVLGKHAELPQTSHHSGAQFVVSEATEMYGDSPGVVDVFFSRRLA